MTTLTVYIFSAPTTAARLARRLEPLRERGLPIHDAAVVEWPVEEHQPRAWQTETISDGRALSGAFWGLLLSQLFLIPLSHPEPREPLLEGDRTLVHLGIGMEQLGTIRGLVTPGSSALFLVAGQQIAHPDAGRPADQVTATLDKILSSLGGKDRRLTCVEFTAEQIERLYAGFALHRPSVGGPTRASSAQR